MLFMILSLRICAKQQVFLKKSRRKRLTLEEICALPLKMHKLPYFFGIAPFEEGRTIKNCNAQRALQVKSFYISLHEWELQIKKYVTNEGLSEICHYSFGRCLARAVGVQAFDLSSCSESFQLYSFLPLPAEHL